MKSSKRLLLIKVIHTVIWAFFVLVIFYILYAGITDRIGVITWLAIASVIVEGIVLLINRWRCPLTIIAEKYTDETDDGFDIFLPCWLAKHNKTIFTTIFAIGVIIVVYRLLS
jgi:cbb3-type cytochrome oxidase subunit 1